MSTRSTMILKQLLNGRQHSNFIIIKDNLQYNGSLYLKQFITENLNKGNAVQFYAFEKENYAYLDNFKNEAYFDFHYCIQDPLNWLSDGDDKTFSAALVEKKLKSGISNIIVIDSISYLLLTYTMKDFCKIIKSIADLNNENCRVQIIGVVHMHLLEEGGVEFNQINRLAKSVIDIKSIDRNIVTHRKHTGKTVREVYQITEKEGALDYQLVKNEEKEKQTNDIDPMKLTTFKLSLEDKEKESRSQVILPYLKNSQTSQGRIFYEPDANDDWDDEDPDDDLDI